MEHYCMAGRHDSRPVKNDRHVGDPNPIWAYCTQLSSESDQEPLDEALLDYIENASPIDSDEIAMAKSLANFHIKMGQQNFFLESDEAITDSNSSTFQHHPSLKKGHRRSSADSNYYTSSNNNNNNSNGGINGKMLSHHDKRRNSKKKYRNHHEHVTNLVQQNANKDFIEDGELADIEVGTISKVLVNKNRHHDRHNYMLQTDRIPDGHNIFTTKTLKMDPTNMLHRKAINKLGHRLSLDSKRAFCEEESQINSGNDRQRKMKMMRKTLSKQSNNSASEMEIDYTCNNTSAHSTPGKASYPLTNDNKNGRLEDFNPPAQNSYATHDTLISRTSDMSSSSDSDIITSDGEISYYETGVEGDDEQSCCEAAFAKWWQDDPTGINDMRLLASGGNFREMKPGTLMLENMLFLLFIDFDLYHTILFLTCPSYTLTNRWLTFYSN